MQTYHHLSVRMRSAQHWPIKKIMISDAIFFLIREAVCNVSSKCNSCFIKSFTKKTDITQIILISELFSKIKKFSCTT